MRIIGQIYEESNYDVFHRLPDNRDLLSSRFNKLIASISAKYILNPIVVNENMEIIDGQGRYEALKALGKPIIYIIANGATSDDCRLMNKYNTKWVKSDFAKSHAKAGKKAYVLLLKCCEETKMPIETVLRLSSHAAHAQAHAMSVLERGDLEFTEEDYEIVKDLAVKITEVLEALQYRGRANIAFATALKVAVETKGYEHERMLKNCAVLRNTYSQMSRMGEQLKEFERIYNYRASKSKRLYFSDYMRDRGYAVRDYTNTAMKKGVDTEDVSTLKEKK
jgi:hypothetical protein